MKVNYHILPDSVVVNFDGQTFPVAKGDGRYNAIIEAIRNGKFDQIPDLVDNHKHFNNVGDGLKLVNNTLYLDDEAMPEVLAERILAFREQKLPYAYLIKFARKLRNNPSYNSRTMLFKFLEHNGHPITPEGNFIAYRGVTKDFKDKHSGKFDNSIGSVCQMPRDEVDDNPNNTCSNGLHVACYDYAHGFGSVTVEVEVDPTDVVCVPVDYNGTKMRVCKFKVVNVSQGVLTSQVYGHTPTADETESDGRCDHGTKNPCVDCGDEEIDDELLDDSDEEQWEDVQLKESSIIECAIWERNSQLLEVCLADGSTYQYKNVPESEISNWEQAPSAGSYYVSFIAHSYTFVKL